MPSKHRFHAASLVAVALGMLMLAYASVPLYRMFCQVTGYGGTTGLASGVPIALSERVITVRFNADVAPGLPWEFKAPKPVQVHLGANTLVSFTAENQSDEPIRGMATYNVAPFSVGPYFKKIQCFCFETQLLPPHRRVNMPVSFYIDPAMLNDDEAKDLKEVTLSYTFFLRKDAKAN